MKPALPTHDEVAGLFYEAALDPAKWSCGLQAFASLAGARGALSLRARADDLQATIFDHVGQNPDAVRDYHEFYQALDPLMPLGDRSPPGAWLNDWRTCGAGLRRTQWYNEFLRKYQTHAVLANLVLKQDGLMASISVQRAPSDGEFTSADEERLAPLIPHLRRAAEIYFATERLREKADLVGAVFEQLQQAIWVLEPNASVVLCNAAASALVAQGAFRVRFGKLATALGADAFARVVRLASAGELAQGHCFSVRADNGEALPVIVLPLAAASPFARQFQRPLAVVTAAGRGTPRNVERMLQVLHGLTPAEARVACAVAAGEAPARLAERTGTSVQTVRVQLRAVYQKTGARRQAELTRLVVKLEDIASRADTRVSA